MHGKGRYVRPRDVKGFSRHSTPLYLCFATCSFMQSVPTGQFAGYEGGRFHNGLMGLNIALTDAHPGDGGFCCIPGSHKGELLPPLEVRRLDVDLGMVQQVVMKAGSVCVFTEALCHGTLPWTAEQERRTLIYRFNPANLIGGKQTLDGLQAVRTLKD